MSVESNSSLYAAVKTWIAKQEAYEAATHTPAPLTNAQRKALEILCIPPAQSSPPDIGDVDYISLLNRYRQAHPEGAQIVWAEGASGKSANGTVMRSCRVTISESRAHPEAPVESFPAVGYGLEDGQSPPGFPKKKEAKQYAAKCAVEWLIAQGLMPSNLEDVVFPRGHRPMFPIPTPSLSPSSQSPNCLTPGSSGDGGGAMLTPPPPPPPKRQTKEGGGGGGAAVNILEPDDDKDKDIDSTLPATQLVATLCHQLGIRAPEYICTASESGRDGYFDAYPDFGHDGYDMPEGLGRVTGVAGGQKRARQEAAALVLKHLVPLQRQRQKLLEGLSAQSDRAP